MIVTSDGRKTALSIGWLLTGEMRDSDDGDVCPRMLLKKFELSGLGSPLILGEEEVGANC